MNILDRVKARLPNEEVDESFVSEAIRLAEDRLNLRLGTSEIPEIFESIVVDITIKIWRRRYHEGIESEKADTINTKFMDNILAEYDSEIYSYLQKESNAKNVVKFI